MTRRMIKWIVLSVLIWFCVHVGVTMIAGLRDDIQKADLAVVFGNKVESSGEPSPRLKSRLDRAVEVYRQKMAPKILVSGGVDPDGMDEARVMADYLIARNVPVTDILLDDKGRNTSLTAKNTAMVMAKYGLKSVIVISQHYHILRIRLTFQKHGIKPVYSAHAEIWEWRDIYSTVREFFAYYYYMIMP